MSVSQAGLRRRSGAVRGGLDKADGAGGSWCGSSRRGRRGAGLNLGLELGHLLRAGQCLQQSVLLLQLGVALNQLFDLLLQDLHLLTHSVHQVAFHQILTDRRTALEPEHLIHVKEDSFYSFSYHSISHGHRENYYNLINIKCWVLR